MCTGPSPQCVLNVRLTDEVQVVTRGLICISTTTCTTRTSEPGRKEVALGGGVVRRKSCNGMFACVPRDDCTRATSFNACGGCRLKAVLSSQLEASGVGVYDAVFDCPPWMMVKQRPLQRPNHRLTTSGTADSKSAVFARADATFMANWGPEVTQLAWEGVEPLKVRRASCFRREISL